MKIFMVDDSPQVIECLREMLSPLAGVLLTGSASDIPEALRSVRTETPHVVILDMHLPSGSGIEVLKAIKKEKLPVKTIVLTNYAFPQYKKKCMELGAYAFLDKSTDFTKVPQLIATLVAQGDHLQESLFHQDSLVEPRTKAGLP